MTRKNIFFFFNRSSYTQSSHLYISTAAISSSFECAPPSRVCDRFERYNIIAVSVDGENFAGDR